MKQRALSILLFLAASSTVGCGSESEEGVTSGKPSPVKMESDWDCDGTNDTCTTFDDRGGILSSDDGCDGVPEYCYSQTYDARGNVLTTRRDEGCDGVLDSCLLADGSPSNCSLCNAYTYDAHGNVLTKRTDFDCDGTEETCHTFMYEGSNMTRHEVDEMCDGMLDSCEAYTHDANGGVLTNDSNCDGVTDSCELHTYDARGALMATQSDDDCDGTPDGSCVSYSY